MLNNEIINKLNSFLVDYLVRKDKPLKQVSFNEYQLKGEYLAINFRNEIGEQVKVVKWFDNFYLFIEVKFIGDHKQLSVSVFQGQAEDEKKHQLLRAEWDDFGNENELHAQPHWHITRDKAVHEHFGQVDFGESKDDPLAVLELANSEIFDTREIHFAMSSDWQNGKQHVHKIEEDENNADNIVNWFRGMLDYLRQELSS